MTTALRKSGITFVGDLPWGTHLCHFYETKADLLDILLPYFKTGLENNEFCLWVVFDPLNEEEARNALRQAVPEADRYLTTGAIEIVAHTQWYLKAGVFDLQEVIRGWLEKLNQALDRGYAGMRANGNEAWLTKKEWSDFSTYEAKLNELIVDHEMLVLCTYPLAKTKATEFFDVARTHQFIIVRQNGRWEVLETAAFKQAKATIKQLNEELEQRIEERTQALAVTNAELQQEILERQHTEAELKVMSVQLRTLAARVTSAREAERARIARELHDELGAILTSIKWELEEMEKFYAEAGQPLDLAAGQEKVEGMLSLIDTSTNTVKRLAAELRPSMLDDLGLGAAIEAQAQQFEARTGIVCQFTPTVEEVGLTWEQATALFRILQEALTNILRHAQATSVSIMLAVQGDEIMLEVRDNGRGITEAQKNAAQSLGLLGMRERMLLVGGAIEITGVAGKGTVLTVRVPLPDEASPAPG